MRKIVRLLAYDPGGWPRGAQLNEEQVKLQEVRVAEARKSLRSPLGLAQVVFALLLVFVYPFSFGSGFALRLFGLFLILILSAFPAPLIRHLLFRGVPANTACDWPMNRKRDAFRSYMETILKVPTVWLLSSAVFLHCVMMMRHGMGDQWNPFTRTIHLTKTGPYSEYGVIEIFMFISGFFAITGLVWWPMYVFFEWLSARKNARNLMEATHG